MKLYFGNMVTTVTTLMIVSLVGFVGYSISNRSSIIQMFQKNQRCTALLLILQYGFKVAKISMKKQTIDFEKVQEDN